MKRILPFAIVGLLILVPAGVVLAAKATKTKKETATKVTHRTSKQKARNERLVKELLTIIEETDNKMTFAACVECLTQLKPSRDVVVPAIIRKADKMGWLRNDNQADTDMIGDCLIQFLPNKQRRPANEPNFTPYMMQYPYPVPPPPPLPAPVIYSAPPCTMPQPPVPSVSTPCQAYAAPVRVGPPPPAPACPIACDSACPTPCPCPTAASHAVPTCNSVQIVAVTTAPAQDKLQTELLKIIDESDSKATFAIVVTTLAERFDNWDAIIPAVIRKADKMGWLHMDDKGGADEFTRDLAQLIAGKLKKFEIESGCEQTPCEKGCTCPKSAACEGDPGPIEIQCVPGATFTLPANLSCGRGIQIECLPDGGVWQAIGRPGCEVVPMPHTEELLPMPTCGDPQSFNFCDGTFKF